MNNNLNPFRNTVSKGVSLFTAVKNRRDLLEKALETWINNKNIDEIIIVDWSSDEPLIPLVQKYQNDKILLAVVPEQEKFIQTSAYNLAARLTTRDQLLKIDGDVKILPGFFEKHILKPGTFFTGKWSLARNENESHLNGNAFYYREDFFMVNGYNEFLKSYGWDDDDLFIRLQEAGSERYIFDLDTLFHQEHEGRMKFLEGPGFLPELTDIETANTSVIINKYLSENEGRWSLENQMMNFSIEILDKHTIKCKPTDNNQNLLPDGIVRMAEKEGILRLLKSEGINISEDILNRLSFEDIIEVYNLLKAKDKFPAYYRLFLVLRKMIETYEGYIDQETIATLRKSRLDPQKNIPA